jgi:hypothetical protein
MTSIRAKVSKQAGWMGLFFLTAAAGAGANSQTCGFVADRFFIASTAEVVGATDADLSFDNIDVIDASLSGKLAVLRVGSDVGANKLLSVFAGLKNKTGHHLDLEIETIYKDTYGNALNSGSWIPFNLRAHEEKEYHSASISEQAADFLVRVRRTTAGGTHG